MALVNACLEVESELRERAFAAVERLLARLPGGDGRLEERGHHRLTIDPAAANARAIRAYEKVGFRPVGIMRQYERGPDGTWHDSLLMDMLASELRTDPST